MRKILLSALAVILIGLLLAGCGGTDKKKVVVGLDDNFPPMGFRDDKNNIVGFDVDMAKEATKRMGVAVEFKPIDWNSKEVELTSKRVDMLWNGLTITEKRKENIAFSNPYMENRQIIVVNANSSLKGKADLAGKVIGVQEGSSSVEAIEKDAATAKSFKELKKYADNVAALMDLKNGRLDAVVVDEIVGRYYIAKKPGDYVIMADHFGSEEYGVGLRKDDKELLTKLQKALDEMKKDGTSAKISKQWFGEDIVK
ncbi:MAG: amino acid ABC transporter substrate-binding protein [Negativicutes bacterium]|nr:amino acid ABC transporter substrate-binding protein [Negativicutes bacterium]